MKLNRQMKALSHFLLLVNVFVFLLSCNVSKENKKNKELNVIDSQYNSQEVKEQEVVYDENNVVKKLIIDQEQSVVFTIDKEGELGDGNFEKYIDVLILKKEKVIDKIEFSNQSILCDIELINPKIINNSLIFSILDSCDGEEPDDLKIFFWKSLKSEDTQISIPKFFENDAEKEELINDILNSEVKEATKERYFIETLSLLLKDR